MSLTSSKSANIPVPYLLLLVRVEKNGTEWGKGIVKEEPWHSSASYESISVQDLPRISLHMNGVVPKLLQSGKKLVCGNCNPSSWERATPVLSTKGIAGAQATMGWRLWVIRSEMLVAWTLSVCHLSYPIQAVSIRKALQKNCWCTGKRLPTRDIHPHQNKHRIANCSWHAVGKNISSYLYC